MGWHAAPVGASSACFNPCQSDRLVFDEGVEHSGSIGTTPHTGNHFVGQPASFFQRLLTSFFSNH
ncbi:MAG: hypothetical protein R3C11_23745 [Planctomycetaceae bacterium]